MGKKLIRLCLSTTLLVCLLTEAALAAPPPQAVTCAEDYIVQAGDSVSSIAQKYYGNVLAYTTIVEATNQAAQSNRKYLPITNANIVEPGRVLCIPADAEAETMLSTHLAAPQPRVAPLPAPIPASGSQSIVFSPDATVSHQPLQLTLKPSINGVIRYTTNGALPDANSQPYTGPIGVNESTVIRAQVFSENGKPQGDVHTKSYILANYDQSIPVISIVADWGDLNVIYENPRERGSEWEKPMNMEYFAPGGQEQFNVKAGIRIHGGFSRMYSPKKSFRLYFRKDYGGPGKLDYPLFPDTPVTEFDKLVLRAGFQDSFHYLNIPEHSDTPRYTAKYVGDQVVRNLHRDMGQPIAHGTWVLLYLNGEFWGLYNLTERVDLQYFQSYSDENSQWDVITKDNGWDDEGNWFDREINIDGDYGAWLENQNWVGSADFYNPGNVGLLDVRHDLENWFSYLFLEAYVQNYDWPHANWIVYRRGDLSDNPIENKWRLMVWDAEYNFGGGSQGYKTDINTLVKVYSPHDSITRVLEKPMIANCGFKVRFWQRAREYLGVENTTNRPANEVGQLSQDRVKAEILKQAAIVRPFIDIEAQRWAPDLNVQVFDQNIANALRFVDEREEVILHHLDELRNQTFTECK